MFAIWQVVLRFAQQERPANWPDRNVNKLLAKTIAALTLVLTFEDFVIFVHLLHLPRCSLRAVDCSLQTVNM